MPISRVVILSSILCSLPIVYGHRNIHRPHPGALPEITTCWSDSRSAKRTCLKSSYLEDWAIFGRYNPKDFEEYLLPASISYRYEPTKTVAADTIEKLIEEFIAELMHINIKPAGKAFEHVIILKDRNFNYRMHAGLIIIKFRNYPFVVKLFIENPDSFTRPYTKGTETSVFFIMGGGMNRFLAGFTRIPNLKALQAIIDADPIWSERITLPRKWYWVPKNVRKFTVEGKNIGTNASTQSLEFPSMYAIICDEIQMERQLNTLYQEDRLLVHDIIQLLGNRLDPHIYNFFIEKGTGKIAIIDTEHFASMVGLKEPMEYNSNVGWYAKLVNKCIADGMFRNKKTRANLQRRTLPKSLIIERTPAS